MTPGTHTFANDMQCSRGVFGWLPGSAGAKPVSSICRKVAGSLGTGTSPTVIAAMPQKLGVVNNANNTQFDEFQTNLSAHLNQKLGNTLSMDVLSATTRRFVTRRVRTHTSRPSLQRSGLCELVHGIEREQSDR